MSSYPRLASRLYNVPLLITPAKLEVIERVFRAHIDGTAPSLPEFKAEERLDVELAALGGATRAQGGYLRTADGVALIQVLGTLVQRGSGMDAMSGLESYDVIGAKLDAAMADPMVRGILFEVDSDGGEGAGLFDLAARVRAADAIKPVTAHSNEKAFSAAYGLAAAAGELYVAPTGMVGSVGVRMLHVDQSTYDAKRGLVYTPIFAGAHKDDFSPHAPLSDAAAAEAQGMVDRLYQTFVAHVANVRGISEDTVRATEAGILHPDQAEANGMVDGTATLGEALASLRKRMTDKQNAPFYQRAAGAHTKENQMTQANTAPAATASAPTDEQLAAARTAGAQEAQAAAAKQVADANAAGAKAERERIAGILAHAEAEGRRKMAEHLAFKTDSTIEAAAALMAVAPKEAASAANPLAAKMDALGNPKVAADAAADDGKPKARIDTKAIYDSRLKAVK
jgi:ClpP class serine protease